MDGAEKALTELAEPLVRLFERWTGVAVDPALGAAIIAMSLVLVGAFAVISSVAMTRRLWLRRRSAPRMHDREALEDSLGDLEKTQAQAAVVATSASPPAGAIVTPGDPAKPVGEHVAEALPAPSRPSPLRPRPLAKAAPKRASPRLIAARKVREAVMSHSGGPGWSANADVPALTSLEVRSIDGIAMRIELMAPEAGAPIYTLNIWSDGAKVFNFEWSRDDEKAEKLRFFKAGDWADDISVWRFAGSLPTRDLRRVAEGGR